tara:strand:- start:101044 stop:101826 length:783 start_codon:yes stop_codon:yes gene_type:complete
VTKFLFSKVIILLLFTTNIQAYRFTSDFLNGFYWQSFPVQMQIFVNENSQGSLLSSLVNQAVNAWESEVGREIYSVPASYNVGSSFGNNIRWSKNFAAETGFDPSSTLAVTTRRTSGTYIGQVEVVLNAEFPGMLTNSGQILYRTILHELGHVIGLDHSEVSQVVMASSLTSATSLQGDDSLGVNAVVDEALYRQSIGFTSELSSSDEKNSPAACGSVDLGGGDGGGLPNILLSLFLGFILILSPKVLRPTRKFFPDQLT